MSSHRKGVLSAAAKAEGLSPEISIVVRGQALHFAETRDGLRVKKGKRGYGVPGSETVAGKTTVMSELGRSTPLSVEEYRVEVEMTTKRNGDRVEVGPAHSRAGEKDCSKGLAEEHGATNRTIPYSETETWRVKRKLITPYGETHTGDAQPKSRMREIRTYGSVRGSRLYSSWLDIVALRISKERRNGENKLNLKGV